MLRAIQFDGEVRNFLRWSPSGTVVSVGEGLETELWRTDNGTVRWISVDLPEMITLRRQLLPEHPWDLLAGLSALDPEWTRLPDPAKPLLVVAQGLLMYFTEPLVRAFFAMVVDRCPGARIVFDTIPCTPTSSGAGRGCSR